LGEESWEHHNLYTFNEKKFNQGNHLELIIEGTGDEELKNLEKLCIDLKDFRCCDKSVESLLRIMFGH
jgi:hypothetical protein